MIYVMGKKPALDEATCYSGYLCSATNVNHGVSWLLALVQHLDDVMAK